MVGEGGAGTQAFDRLRVMEETSDGFKIAEKDLQLRGPGVVFGTQQHGLTDLQFLEVILGDPRLLDAARTEAQGLAAEPGGRDRAREILESLRPAWKQRLELARIG